MRLRVRSLRFASFTLSAILVAVGAAAVSTPTLAQMKSGGMSMGPRGGMMMNQGGRMGPQIGNIGRLNPGRVPGGKGGVVAEPGRDGGPGRRPPGRRPPGGVPPWLGPAVGTGVLIATPGPASGGPILRPPTPGTTVAQRRGIHIPPANENRFVKDEVLLEFAGQVSNQQATAMAARHRLTRLESHYFPLTRSTLFRWKINDGRSVRTVLVQLGRERTLGAAQPNFIYSSTQAADAAQNGSGAVFTPPDPSIPTATPVVAAAGAHPSGSDPAQYAVTKLRLGEAHAIVNGDRILVAVIDSGIDLGHPELQGAVAGSFDALGKAEKPHPHGTAIAGAIAARARLMGAAPAARILAIRAFGASGASAEATTMAILTGIKHATERKARIINMSFAGPADPGLSRHLAAAKLSGAVLVAAAGNFGPKSPPQYPAADPSVIAVSAIDAGDQMFKASNIGDHITVAAPGVDLLLPAPDNNYQVTSGTSFSAAYVSGVTALILQRAPWLTPDEVRKVLEGSAKDLGPAGKDAEYGAGLVDAYQAIVSVPPENAKKQPPPKPTARSR